METSRLKLEGKGATGSGYRVWLNDTELTNITRAISVDLDIDDANTATFTVYVNEVELDGDVDPKLIRAEGKERTSLASRFREWLGS